jgi:ribosomal subunit interface protein
MRLELTGRHVDVLPALRRLVERKITRLERMLNDNAVSAQVVLTREKRGRRSDVTLHARGEKFLHGVGSATSWEASVSQAVDKIAQQAQRVKGKWRERKRRAGGLRLATAQVGLPAGRTVAAPANERDVRGRGVGSPPAPRGRSRQPRIFRQILRPVRTMSVADAAREIDETGEGVVVFRDVESAAISVLVRQDGTGELTLVRTEPFV